jgi:hypothetical protein
MVDMLIEAGLPLPSLDKAITSTKNKDLLAHLNLRKSDIHARIKEVNLAIHETHHSWPPGLAEIIAHFDRTLPLSK